MKNLTILNFLIDLIFLLSSINKSEQNEINVIPDAHLNATAAFVDLGSMKKDRYLYFSYDFDYHRKVNSNQGLKMRNTAYFTITTDFSLELNYIEYMKIFDLKKQELYIEREDIYWNKEYILKKQKNGNDFIYHIEITAFTVKTIILRIPFLKNEGQITIENIDYIPQKNSEKNEIENRQNYGKQFTYRSNQNNNYNNNIDKINELPPPLNPSNNMEQNQFNQYHNYNYPNNYHYNDNYHIHKIHHYHYTFYNPFFSLIGIVLLQMWIIIFILYCLVNRRKKNERINVVVGIIQQ